MGELKRAFRPTRCIILAAAILLNLCLFAYQMMEGHSLTEFKDVRMQYEYLMQRYAALPLSESLQTVTEDKIYEGEFGTYYDSLSEKNQNALVAELKRMKNKIPYLEGYERSVDEVLERAEAMQKRSLFNKKGSFSYSNVIHTGKDFERVNDVSVMLDSDRGVEEFIHYKMLYYIAGALMLMFVYDLMAERTNGVWHIVHGAKYGREKLAVRRTGLLVFESFIVTAGLYITTFLEAMSFWGGWSDLINPIQTITDFGKFTYAYSKIGYIIILFGISWMVLACLSVILWMAFVSLRNRNYTLVVVGIFIGIEIFLYKKIEIQSSLSALHFVNVVSLLGINELYSGYLNWGFKNTVVSAFSLTISCLIIISILAVVVLIIRGSRIRPEKKTTVFGRVMVRITSGYQKCFMHFAITFKEFHKFLITSKGYIFVGIIILISLYSCSTSEIKYSEAQKERDAVYAQHGGENYTYIQTMIDEKKQLLNEATESFKSKAKEYQDGLITLEEYSAEMNELSYAQVSLKQIEEYDNKMQYLEQTQERYGVRGWIISDRGYDMVFGEKSKSREMLLLIVLLIGTMLILSESNVLEYDSGMHKLLNGSCNGRSWLTRRKIYAAVILTVLMFVIVYVIDFLYLKERFCFVYMNAPLASLSFVKDYMGYGMFASEDLYIWLISMSIGNVIFLRILLRLFILIISMGIAMLMSRFAGRSKARVLTWVVILMWAVFVYGLVKWTMIL